MSVYDQLIGQSHLIEKLTAAAKAAASGEESQEMTHAWIFTGPPGSGRSSAAIAFAQALVCKSSGCGTCKDRKSTRLNSSHSQQSRMPSSA